MMLRHLGWKEAADLIIRSMEAAIADKIVTYDFARLMEGATEVMCSAFGRDDRQDVRLAMKTERSVGAIMSPFQMVGGGETWIRPCTSCASMA